MAYNITNISASNNALELTQRLNESVNGNFAIGILVLVYFMTFGYFIRYSTVQAHIGGSFITMVVGFLLFFMKLITWEILAVPIALFIIGLIIQRFTTD